MRYLCTSMNELLFHSSIDCNGVLSLPILLFWDRWTQNINGYMYQAV